MVSLSNENPDYGIDMTGVYANDPGFQKELSPFTGDAICTGSLPLSAAFCQNTYASNNASCSLIPGCEWVNVSDTLFVGWFVNMPLSSSDAYCYGIPDLSDFGGGCSPLMNETLCRLLGCQWMTMSNPEAQQAVENAKAELGDLSAIKKSFGIMTGFSAGFGIPGKYMWIISILVFWIPLIALAIAIYTLVPFI